MRGIEKYLEVACRTAREAGLMLKEGLDRGMKISFKGIVDLVTNCDTLSQKMIFERLTAAFPGHGILAEEGLSHAIDSEYRWVVDPLDGTTNFAHRLPFFCVSMALEHRGKIILGVVYDPVRDEMFTAAAGRGAYLNGKKIRVSVISNLTRGLVATGFPYDVRESRINNIRHFNNFLTRAQAVRRLGSAAIELCYVGCGRLDGFWELKLKPWDASAGGLIVQEAGGKVTDFAGGAYNPYHPEVLGPNGLIHEAMRRVLNLPEKETPGSSGGRA